MPTKTQIATLRTAPSDGSPSDFVVHYFFADLKPADYREAYDDLVFLAQRDYGDIHYSVSASGIGVDLTPAQIKPAHAAVASRSFQLSLLRQGWRFDRGSYFVVPIPVAELAELAHSAALHYFGITSPEADLGSRLERIFERTGEWAELPVEA